MVKRLTLEDQMTSEEYAQHIDQYTDEDAQRHGYPSVDVLHLEMKLSEIAGAWRETKDKALILEYKVLLYEMIFKGFDVNELDVQDQLPPEVMPELPSESVQSAILNVYATAK